MGTNLYKLEQTAKTPFVNFVASSGHFELKGKSIPENSVNFYRPILEWLDIYVQNPAPKTTLNVQLDYFNTSSSRSIVELCKKLEVIIKNKKGEASINWYYDDYDEDMMETGEDYQSIIQVPINLISFKS